MGDDDQFSSRGDYGNVVVLFSFQTPEEPAQRAGMLSYLLRGLGQKPSRLRVASFGNTSIVAGVSRLVHAWRQPKITGGHIAMANRRQSPNAATRACAAAAPTPGSVISKRTSSFG